MQNKKLSSARLQDIDLRGIVKSFGNNDVLKGLDVSCRSGEIVMLIGPNGSGKSTLLRILLGLISVDAGQLMSAGENLHLNNSYKQQIGYLPENIAFCETLSGREVLKFFIAARGLPRQRVDEMLEWAGLTAAGKRRTGSYSKGMRQRLGLAIAVAHKPTLLILDEPTSGLDQEGLSLLWQVMKEFRSDGRMILLTSHNLGLLERRVDRVCILKDGRQLFFGTPDDMRYGMDDEIIVRVSLQANAEGLEDETDAVSVAMQAAGLSYTVPCADERRLSVSDAFMPKVWKICDQHQGLILRVRTEEPVLEEVYECLLGVES